MEMKKGRSSVSYNYYPSATRCNGYYYCSVFRNDEGDCYYYYLCLFWRILMRFSGQTDATISKNERWYTHTNKNASPRGYPQLSWRVAWLLPQIIYLLLSYLADDFSLCNIDHVLIFVICRPGCSSLVSAEEPVLERKSWSVFSISLSFLFVFFSYQN